MTQGRPRFSATALAVSRALPPPMPTTTSQPWALHSSILAKTSSLVASPWKVVNTTSFSCSARLASTWAPKRPRLLSVQITKNLFPSFLALRPRLSSSPAPCA